MLVIAEAIDAQPNPIESGHGEYSFPTTNENPIGVVLPIFFCMEQ
jgi:hypothetical protein